MVHSRLHLHPPFFAHPFFLFFSLSPCGTSELHFSVEEKALAGAGFWGRVSTGSPHKKKGFFPTKVARERS